MVVTPLYAGLLVLWYLVLSARVIGHRRARRIKFGDGGHPEMQRTIRGQANFSEYVPLALVLLAIIELSRFSIYVVHALGMVLLLARLIHGYAFSFARESMSGRYWGALLTFVVLAVEAVLCLYQAYVAHAMWFAA